MLSYQYRKSHCGDKTVVRSSYLHNGNSYIDKTSLYWIRPCGDKTILRRLISTMGIPILIRHFYIESGPCGATINDKVGIMITVSSQWYRRTKKEQGVYMSTFVNIYGKHRAKGSHRCCQILRRVQKEHWIYIQQVHLTYKHAETFHTWFYQWLFQHSQRE